MFKAIFRIISLVLIIIIIIIGLAVWKGGEPFRWIGRKTEVAGQTLIQFGDIIDELRGKKEKAEEVIKQLKDTIAPGEGKATKQRSEDKNATINKHQKVE